MPCNPPIACISACMFILLFLSERSIKSSTTNLFGALKTARLLTDLETNLVSGA